VAYRSSSVNKANSATAPNTAVPAGVAANDIIVLLCSFDQSTATFSGNWPTGFTHLDEAAVTLDGQKVGIAWKRASGADIGSYTMTATPGSGVAADWAMAAAAFTGRDTGNPPVKSNVSVSSVNNSSPVSGLANGVTALTGDDLLWLCGPDRNSGTSTTVFTAPPSHTLRQSTDQGFTTVAVSTRDSIGSGPTGQVTGTFTLSAGFSGYAAWLVRVPAATVTSATAAAGPVLFPPFGPMFRDPYATPFQLLGDTTTAAAASAAGSLVFTGTASVAGAGSATGSVAFTGSAAAGAAVTVAGSLALTGQAAALALALASGSLALAGTSAGTAVAGAAGSLAFTGSAAVQAPATATGSVALSGAAGVSAGADPSTAPPAVAPMFLDPAGASFQTLGDSTATPPGPSPSGALTLSGTATTVGQATASGALTLTAVAAVQAATAPAGGLAFTGSASGGSSSSAAGSVNVTGVALTVAAATASGPLDLSGAAAGSPSGGASGSVTLTGTLGAAAALLATGGLTLAGSGAGFAPASASGTVTLAGTVIAQAAAVAAGVLALTGQVTLIRRNVDIDTVEVEPGRLIAAVESGRARNVLVEADP
jgi:hypothetical protein